MVYTFKSIFKLDFVSLMIHGDMQSMAIEKLMIINIPLGGGVVGGGVSRSGVEGVVYHEVV